MKFGFNSDIFFDFIGRLKLATVVILLAFIFIFIHVKPDSSLAVNSDVK